METEPKVEVKQAVTIEEAQGQWPAPEDSAAVEEFSPKRLEALVALAKGVSVTGTAQAAGVDRSTVHRWLQNPEFLAERDRLVQRTAWRRCSTALPTNGWRR